MFGGMQFTNRGKTLQAKAQAGARLNFTRIVVGDGELGSSAIADLTNLIRQIQSLSITKLKPLSNGKAVVGTVMSNEGLAAGFYWRELGVFATDPDLGEILYCYGNAGAAAEYIPAGGGPDIVEKAIDVISIIGNAANVTASIEQSLVYASAQDLANHEVDYTLQVPYAGVTTGSANTYAIATPVIAALAAGMAVSLRFHTDSTGASTLNWNGKGAKGIKKANGADATNLKAAGIYTLRYDGQNFILQGEGASGNAAASDLLSGKTASTDAGDITGTMVNNGPAAAETISLTAQNQEYTIAAGFHSGLRKIKAVITGLVASVIKAGVTVGGILGTFTADATAVDANVLAGETYYRNGVQGVGAMPDMSGTNADSIATSITGNTIYLKPPEGYYNGLSGTNVKATNANLAAANLKAGISLYGLLGTFTADATAAAAQILYGYIGYKNGAQVVGTMPSNGSQTATLSISDANKPTKVVPAGYTPGGTITAQLAAALAPLIKEGSTIGGVVGAFHAMKWASGVVPVTVNPNAGGSAYFSVDGLDFTPQFVICAKNGGTNIAGDAYRDACVIVADKTFKGASARTLNLMAQLKSDYTVNTGGSMSVRAGGFTGLVPSYVPGGTSQQTIDYAWIAFGE